jgi:hypothetical protein
MVWYNPFSWSSSSTTEPEAVSSLPPATEDPSITGARRRRTRSTRTFTVRHGRKGSKRYQSKRTRTGRKSIR